MCDYHLGPFQALQRGAQRDYGVNRSQVDVANLAVTDWTHVCTDPSRILTLISSYDRLKQRLSLLLCPDLFATPPATMRQAS